MIMSVCALAHAQNLDFFDPTRQTKKVEEYRFHVDYRIEAGYIQQNHRSDNLNYPNMYLHGGRIGASFDFALPLHFSIQTGLYYALTYGQNEQHFAPVSAEDIYANTNFIRHRVMEHQLLIPVRAYYTFTLKGQWRMFFYGGPQLQIGLASRDNVENRLTPFTTDWLHSIGFPIDPYDKYQIRELGRVNVQMGVGGGFEWDRYRIQAGYDFGLNNLISTPSMSSQFMWEWTWFAGFCFKF